MASIGGRRGEVGFSPWHQDFDKWIEQGIGSDQPLNVERGAGDNETSNVEKGVGVEYRAGERSVEGMSG
jgi:hypothetical protein